MNDTIEVPRALLERLDELLNSPVRGPVVRMQMPERGDYGCYWELDGGYLSEDALEMAAFYCDRISLIAREVADIRRRVEVRP